MIHRRVRVYGTVQGVGFRPTVFRLATELGLSGWVLNDGAGVEIALQGDEAALAAFLERLPREVEAPGQVDRLEVTEAEVDPALGPFRIAESEGSAPPAMSLAPDGRVCSRCAAEVCDPKDRRYRYPFTNCTRCGPRYTIVTALPYDRPRTTLVGFPLCADCAREYHDPANRRHHAQPLACPVCGPWAWLADPRAPYTIPARPADPGAAVEAAARALAEGKIVAVLGLGGFQLAVNARDVAAVARLRAAKRRARKPLAVMARDLTVATELIALDAEATAALTASAAPIVLAPARDLVLSASLAPGLSELGVMLPTTPLHQGLFAAGLDLLVMTSGNASGEPILTDAATALAELPADLFLLHNRPIAAGVDDSVVRAGPRGVLPLRRARGYVPRALPADFLPPVEVLALGAHLKLTVATLARGELVLSRHLGDLDNPRAEASFEAEIERMLRFGRVRPQAVACDLHPDLYSSEYAAARWGHLPLVGVQHHHAHLAAAMVDGALPADAQVVGVMLDGLGYHPDGTLWGGEVLVGGYREVRRVAWLGPVEQPGGDRAALEPARMAHALLDAAGRRAHPLWDPRLAALSGSRFAPRTSAAGRVLDGAAALLGIAPARQDYDAEAPSLLEAVALTEDVGAYALPLLPSGALDVGRWTCDLLDDTEVVAVRAARALRGLAGGLAAAAIAAAAREGLHTAVLGGGVMANRLILDTLATHLEQAGLRVVLPHQLPPGDGGLSVGQAAVAACRLA